MKKLSLIEKRLEASGYNLEKGYAPPNVQYTKGWNEAIRTFLKIIRSGNFNYDDIKNLKR